MPGKYAIHTATVPHRFQPLARSGIIAWEEGCLKCAVCVKKQCVYGVYDRRGIDPVQMIDSIDNQCMSCLRCVQSCPKELIHKSLNPEYEAMGDAWWRPDIIASLWSQAQTGKIPVSGAGYPGPFSGPGFDAMWTDMSEIVRPTRDGIHGREYISTAIDIGQTPGHLSFDDHGNLTGDLPRVMDIPLPIILRMPSFGAIGPETIKGWATAARRLGTLFSLPWETADHGPEDLGPWLVPSVVGESGPKQIPSGARLVEVAYGDGWEEAADRIQNGEGSPLISVRIPLTHEAAETALSLVRAGVSVIHLEGTMDGRFQDDDATWLKDGIRAVHLRLVEENLRDGITLLAGGGISMAEHVAKSIICGADGVVIDFPILIALECRMCRRCTKGLSCPVAIDHAGADWIAYRVVNLLGAWHNQLLEVMGAMGIRDVRRLRGEAGRAMFFEELEKDTFSTLDQVEEGYEIE